MAVGKTRTLSERIGCGVLIVLGWLAALGMHSCSKDKVGVTEEPKTLAEMEAQIGKDAILLMDAEPFHRTYAKLGKARFTDANNLTRWAAIAVASSGRCTIVDDIAISDEATRTELQWFADCSNGERFQVTEAQAKAAQGRYDPGARPEARIAGLRVAMPQPQAKGRLPTSGSLADFDEIEAVSRCNVAVEKTMLVPGSFSIGWTQWAIAKDASTGKVTIQRDFKSENAYGMRLNSRYSCVVDVKSGAITGLSIRQPDGWKKLL